ncbi:hypothetical protein CMU73_10855 [Elizabethkingia anophelis]|nr:hypothetical protein BBD31_11910 [Elizabethkingia anophelis]ASV78411.1 hypothetical protein A6J37_07145 [Elizabethkingia anophelis]MDV3551923.1 hypothetical protein [Elizabethkingia anophelis]MDV3571135.1 hypothetical protein [Elizabethkingia anophelis]MDV3588658.1 hypothetical protein [Elizabethkingia anophelis]
MKKNYHIVSHKPRSCLFCKGRIVTIIYGSVPPETVQEAIEGKLILGGRFVSADESPKWACINCSARFLEGHIGAKVVHPLQRFYRSVLKIIGVLAIIFIMSSIMRSCIG